MLLPGPEAQQLATWLGWRLHGVRGGIAAGLLFVLPGLLVMLGLSALVRRARPLGLGRAGAAGPEGGGGRPGAAGPDPNGRRAIKGRPAGGRRAWPSWP
jgi:hypothetical protein